MESKLALEGARAVLIRFICYLGFGWLLAAFWALSFFWLSLLIVFANVHSKLVLTTWGWDCIWFEVELRVYLAAGERVESFTLKCEITACTLKSGPTAVEEGEFRDSFSLIMSSLDNFDSVTLLTIFKSSLEDDKIYCCSNTFSIVVSFPRADTLG
jgi:hypothetical protein